MSPRLIELADKLNKDFNPGMGLKSQLADLDALLKDNKISNDVYTKARDSAICEVAERLGAGGPAKLTNAALAGSQEDARLLSNFMAGSQSRNTNDLLKLIEQHLRFIKDSNGRMAEERPLVADFGGGDF